MEDQCLDDNREYTNHKYGMYSAWLILRTGCGMNQNAASTALPVAAMSHSFHSHDWHTWKRDQCRVLHVQETN